MWQVLSKIRRSEPLRTLKGIWTIFLYLAFHAENNFTPSRQVIKNVIVAISKKLIAHNSLAEITGVWSPVCHLRAAYLISESQSACSSHRTLLGLGTSQRIQTSLGRMSDEVTECHFLTKQAFWWNLKNE